VHEPEFLQDAVASLLQLELIVDQNPEMQGEALNQLELTEDGAQALDDGFITVSEIWQDEFELYFKADDFKPIRAEKFQRHEIASSQPQAFKVLPTESYQEALDCQLPGRVGPNQSIVKIEPLNQTTVQIQVDPKDISRRP